MVRHVRVRRGMLTALAIVGSGLTAAGCTLEELTLVEAQERVVAEVFVQLAPDLEAGDRVTALLHRTLDAGTPTSRPVEGAAVRIRRSDGLTLELAPAGIEACAVTLPDGGTATCYAAGAQAAGRLGPGDRLEVEITLPGGGALAGVATVPGGFTLLNPMSGGLCRSDPVSPFEVRWTRSEGAWSYVNEALIAGLRDALAPRGIVVEDDPLFLLGLSISAADTTIVFPGEFGVFNRFELDQDLALSLQTGLPAGTAADVSITAVERNYVNWVRGGNFNPSGQVRVPSLRGDGTGVFGATVTRRLGVRVEVDDGTLQLPSCEPS